jgi:hypothetical protein
MKPWACFARSNYLDQVFCHTKARAKRARAAWGLPPRKEDIQGPERFASSRDSYKVPSDEPKGLIQTFRAKRARGSGGYPREKG